jgi:hypothetical protein
MPNKIKLKPPIHGLFHEKTRIITNKIVGIKCINNARRVFRKPVPWPKTSKAKKLIKIAKRMVRILGAQFRKRSKL